MSAALPTLPLPDKQSCEDDPMYGIMPVYHYTAAQTQTYAQQARADLESENAELKRKLEEARALLQGIVDTAAELARAALKEKP